ncbi:hypothetical protein BC829DRAFT_293535 [Chytridium lagenaria]|nr:hypothetical protein BC829DRAFT_293535 [Chytridium lagenaria]
MNFPPPPFHQNGPPPPSQKYPARTPTSAGPNGPPPSAIPRGPAVIITPNPDGFYIPDQPYQGPPPPNLARTPSSRNANNPRGPPINPSTPRGPPSSRSNPSQPYSPQPPPLQRVLRVKVRTSFKVTVPPSPSISPATPSIDTEWRYKFDILFTSDTGTIHSATLDRSHGELFALHLSLLKRFPIESGRRNAPRRIPFAESPTSPPKRVVSVPPLNNPTRHG